jgi:hypothetical protein
MIISELITALSAFPQDLRVGVEYIHPVTQNLETSDVHLVQQINHFVGSYLAIVPANV